MLFDNVATIDLPMLTPAGTRIAALLNCRNGNRDVDLCFWTGERKDQAQGLRYRQIHIYYDCVPSPRRGDRGTNRCEGGFAMDMTLDIVELVERKPILPCIGSSYSVSSDTFANV